MMTILEERLTMKVMDLKKDEKKTLQKKLRINKETIKELRDQDLKMAAGRFISITFTIICCTY
jgi:hypothetical protein